MKTWGYLEKVPLLKSKQNFEQIWRNKRRARQRTKVIIPLAPVA